MAEETGKQGSEDGKQEPDDKSGGQQMEADKNEPSKDEKTFTQADVSKMMTKEKNQGRTAALKDLGIDPTNTAAIEEVKKFIQSKKPEPQVLAEQQIEAANKIKEAEHRAFLAETKAEIMQAGVGRDYIDDAMALVLAKKTDETFDLSAAINTIKTKYPVWFEASSGQNQQEGSKGTGNPVKSGSGGSGQTKEDDFGKRLAEQRKSGAVESPYWGQNERKV